MAKKATPTPRRKPARRTTARAGDKTPATSGTSPWEWVAAAAGGLILLALVGFLVHAGIARPAHPEPDIVAVPGPAVRLESGAYLVPLRVENRGRMTGANVTVRGSLRDEAGALIEESTATFDFVAQHSGETGGLYFTADPGSGTLTVRTEGYADP